MTVPPAPTRASMRVLDAVRDSSGGFDIDAWHVMDQRDNALISDELIYGAGSSKFVYNFEIKGQPVTGISVVGARHLAAYYGGIKHRMVGSIHKIGSLFTFTSYPSEGVPMQVQCNVIHDLAEEPDFYGAIVEVMDIKTGNTLMTEVRENRFEKTRTGTSYERPHYSTIAQSKAYRNGVLALVRQDIQIEWKLKQLALAKSEQITGSVLDEKRAGVLKFAAAKGIAVNRASIEALTMDQISGLAEAARAGGVEQFKAGATSLKVMGSLMAAQDTAPQPAATTLPSTTSRQEPQQQRQAAPAEPKATPRAQAAQRDPAPASEPVSTPTPPVDEPDHTDPFWLVDAEGFQVDGAAPFTSPVAYAEALEKFITAAFPADRAAILEQNEEFIGPAAHASPAAAAIFARIKAGDPAPGVDEANPPQEEAMKPREEAPQAVISMVVAVPQRAGGKPDHPAYVQAVRTSLIQHVTTEETLAAWRAANEPVYKDMPRATKFGIDAAIADCRKTLGLDKPPVAAAASGTAAPAEEPQSSPPAAAEPAAEDKPRAWATAAIATISAMKDGGEALRWIDTNHTDMTWMKANRPELYAEVREAIARKQQGAV